MKYTFASLLFILNALNGLSQKTSDKDIGYQNYINAEIELKYNHDSPKIAIPFKTVVVYDYRNDTGVNAFIEIKSLFNIQKKYYTFPEGSAEAIKTYLNKVTTPDLNSEFTLVLIIRKLWASSEIENSKSYDTDNRMQEAYIPGLKSTFEFYAEKDNLFTPIKRFDTILVKNDQISNIITDLISETLKASMRNIAQINPGHHSEKKKKLLFSQIDSFSSIHKHLVILQDTPLKKGVYKTFNEFKKNSPSIQDYEIKKTGKADLLFVKDEAGNEYPTRAIWGFCDGTFIYIKSANIFFKLEKFKNNFYAIATKALTVSKEIDWGRGLSQGFIASGLGGGVAPGGYSYNIRLKTQLMQLDLETGILY
jgi:hypothetical protein